MDELSIEGVWLHSPTVHADARGAFMEWFQGATFDKHIGHPLNLAQANISVSTRGVLRGIHFAQVPPGQAKYVTCTRGAIFDVVVDIRVGSPTFGAWEGVQLDDADRRAIYIAEGLGHAFYALTDDATVTYLCSQPFNAGREHGVHPLDPAIGVEWPGDVEPQLSEKDAAAPTLAEARATGLLPTYDEYRRWVDSLRGGG
jgi:dTDP-4-dehydrorhamnose 3,5-epimerase